MRYLTCAETAKLIRKDLKKNFPTIKFSVHSKTYSMGASIRINWTDGPTSDQVSSVTCVYEGKGFDGMIDLAYYKTSYILPSGEVCRYHTEGTEGSGGAHRRVDNELPEGAEPVSFGADYIFPERSISFENELAVAEKLRLQYDVKEPLEIMDSEWGKWIRYPNVMIWNDWFNTLVHRWFFNIDLTA